MVAAIRRVVVRRGGVEPRVKGFPWWALPLLAPFDETLREMREVRRFWHEPLRLDNSSLLTVLGDEPHTPLEQAVEATLLGLGCLDEAPTGLATA